MDRVNRILYHPFFVECMVANANAEKERIFCRHNMAHAMDVARIAYILYTEQLRGTALLYGEQEENIREMIYAAALLHDIGRFVQYETGEKHAAVSARLAPTILYDCGYEKEEIELIVRAIQDHGDKGIAEEASLRGILAKADLLSRACYACEAREQCHWKESQKNMRVIW